MTPSPSSKVSPSNAEMIAELQSVAIAIRLFGLDRLVGVMNPARAALKKAVSE